jgi:hypothetical protein
MAKLPVSTVAVPDCLPQPFRLIDKTLGYIIERCFDVIDRRQQAAVSPDQQRQARLCQAHSSGALTAV